MTDDDRIWLTAVADALDKAQRHVQVEHGERMVTIAISDELARGVADRLRAIAESDCFGKVVAPDAADAVGPVGTHYPGRRPRMIFSHDGPGRLWWSRLSAQGFISTGRGRR